MILSIVIPSAFPSFSCHHVASITTSMLYMTLNKVCGQVEIKDERTVTSDMSEILQKLSSPVPVI